MPHTGIFGPTQCGKTTLGKSLCTDWERRKWSCLVLDPLGSKWPCTWQTEDAEDFIAKAKQAKNCKLFVDEAGLTINRERAMQWLFVTARHWGHQTFVLGHAGGQLLPVMRQQIGVLYLFRTHPDEVDMWQHQFIGSDLSRAAQLQQYEFLKVEQFAPVRGPLKLNLAV